MLCAWALDAVDNNTHTIYAWSLVPPADTTEHVQPSSDNPSVKLSKSFGFEASALGLVSDIQLPLTESTLSALTAVATAEDAGYQILSFVDGIDDQYVESTGILKGLLDVEAPTGDITWEADPVTPEAYRAYLQELADSGQHTVETIALCPQGEVVAQTQVILSQCPDSTMQITSTLVHRDHRGKGLGRLVKAENIRTIQQRFPSHHRLSTSSEVTNRHMLDLNREFGFHTTTLDIVWRKKLTSH